MCLNSVTLPFGWEGAVSVMSIPEPGERSDFLSKAEARFGSAARDRSECIVDLLQVIGILSLKTVVTRIGEKMKVLQAT